MLTQSSGENIVKSHNARCWCDLCSQGRACVPINYKQGIDRVIMGDEKGR